MAIGQKHGGRKAGTPNKNKTELLEAIRDAVGDKDYHPVIQMALVATNEETVERYIKVKGGEHIQIEEPRYSEELQLQAAKEIAQYVSPKLKAIEHTAGEDGFGLNLFMNIGPPPPKKKKGNSGSRR